MNINYKFIFCLSSLIPFLLYILAAIVSLSKTGIHEVADVCDVSTSFGLTKLFACCCIDTNGGGWMVIQRRIKFNGSVDFYQDWTDYV